MERALTWARQERATLRAAMGKPSVDDHDIPQDEQLRVLRKLFDRYYAEAAEEGSFLFPAVADTLGALHAKACRWRWLQISRRRLSPRCWTRSILRNILPW